MAKQSHFGKLHEIPILKTFILLEKNPWFGTFVSSSSNPSQYKALKTPTNPTLSKVLEWKFTWILNTVSHPRFLHIFVVCLELPVEMGKIGLI